MSDPEGGAGTQWAPWAQPQTQLWDKAASAPQEDDGSGAQDAGFQRQEDPHTKLKSHGAGGRLSRTPTVYSSNGLHNGSQPKGGNGPRVP